MPAEVGIAWTVFGVISGGLFLFSTLFTRYYQSKRDSELLATLTSILALGLIFSTVALLPIDIFLVSSTVDTSTGLKKLWADRNTIYWMTFTVKVMYYVFYGLILGFTFFFIPFAYFYYEEYEEEGQTRKQRVASALRYTMFFIIICSVLFLFGLFLKPNMLPPHIDLEWFKNLLTESNGAKAIWFVVGCLFIPGMVVFIVYTAPGLSILPFRLIKGKRRLDAEFVDVESRLSLVREQQRLLEHKNAGCHINSRDNRTLENLNDEERILTRRLSGIKDDEASLLYKFLRCLRPFQILIGLLLLVLTVIIVVSILMTIIDKVLYSVCGRKCGYIISHPDLFNPVNFIFVRLQRAFPLDYIFMVGIIIYVFLATMTGIIQIGVRFLWVTLYRIKRGSTAPQGLLFSAMLLTFGLLALNYSVTSVVAPGYAHFGSQVYLTIYTTTFFFFQLLFYWGVLYRFLKHTYQNILLYLIVIVYEQSVTTQKAVDEIALWKWIKSCPVISMALLVEICTPTVSSTLIDRITLNTPTFGLLFYYSQWVFLVSFALGFVISLFRPATNNVDAESPDALNAEEEAGLLDGR